MNMLSPEPLVTLFIGTNLHCNSETKQRMEVMHSFSLCSANTFLVYTFFSHRTNKLLFFQTSMIAICFCKVLYG